MKPVVRFLKETHEESIGMLMELGELNKEELKEVVQTLGTLIPYFEHAKAKANDLLKGNK